MTAQAAGSRSRLPLFLIGCAALAVCGLTVGVVGVGAWFYTQSRPAAPEPAVEYLLDASPRMALAGEGGTRLSVAQAVLAEIVRPANPQVAAGLRVFGTGELPESCKDTRLVVPLAPANQGLIASELAALEAGPAADAAMAEAMLAAIRDLTDARGPHTLVVVTGGQDSCNPQAGQLIAEEAARAGVELELFVVGYQVPAVEAEAIRGMVGETAGAQYLEAQDENGLRAILKAIQQRVDNRGSLPLADILATARAVAAVPTATPVPAAEVSLEAATQLVLEQVLQPATLDHEAIVFAWPEALGPGDILAPYAYPPLGLPPEPIAIPAESWFFWIDDFPNGMFEHPNRYVLVDRATGALTVSDEAWWPVLNGVGLWITLEDYWNEANWVFDNFEGRPREAAAAPGPARLARLLEEEPSLPAQGIGMGLVLNGWLPDQPNGAGLAQNAQHMADAFTNLGLLTHYLGPAEGVTAQRLGGLDPASLSAYFEQNGPQLAAGDTLFVYGTGHGGRTPDGGVVQAGFSMEALAALLKNLDAEVEVVLIFDGSYSGLSIPVLLPYVDRIITAADTNTPAAFDADHPTDPDPADRGSEFTSAIAAQFDALGGSEDSLLQAFQQAVALGQSHWQVLAEGAYNGSLSADSNAVRGVTFPQIAPKPAVPIAENEAPQPQDRVRYGPYAAVSRFQGGNREHFVFIQLPVELSLEVLVKDGVLTFDGPGNWVDVTGAFIQGDAFQAQGTGTVAGFPNILVTFEGTLDDTALNGLYTMGADGRLPGGQSITYYIEGKGAGAAAAQAPPIEKIEDFLRNFVSARRINFTPFLLARLDPAVYGVYGEAACQAEFARREPDPTFAIDIINIGAQAELWVYSVDGRSVTVPAYSVEVALTQMGETITQIAHFGVSAGRVTWFTDCGDPLP